MLKEQRTHNIQKNRKSLVSIPCKEMSPQENSAKRKLSFSSKIRSKKIQPLFSDKKSKHKDCTRSAQGTGQIRFFFQLLCFTVNRVFL